MICWYCHWGWPKAVADIYLEALQTPNGDDAPLLYGPAHVVWSDENFDSAAWCLEHFDAYRGDHGEDELAIVRRSLEQLAALPESAWNVEPENYLPPPNVEMIRLEVP